MADDGRHFTALSDRGHITAGTLLRDTAGRIVGVTHGALLPLRGADGNVLGTSRADSEGLAVAPDGRIYISFEGWTRIQSYDRPGGRARLLPRTGDFARFDANGSLESLAIAPDGTLYTTPEDTKHPGQLLIYRYRAGHWDQPFALPTTGAYRPVGADFGPDGRYYLLERRFTLLGFSTRVRRFEFGPDGPGSGEVLLQTPLGTYQNLEGLSVWRDRRGRIRLTMISDDNFSPLLKTQIVEYGLTE